MFRKKQDNRTFIQKNNDDLVIWEYLGGPAVYIIGLFLIGALVTGFFWFQGHSEEQERKEILEARVKIFESYIEKNSSTFTNIKEKWNEGNLFYAKNDKGVLRVRFVNNKITEVIFTSNSGQEMTVYQE